MPMDAPPYVWGLIASFLDDSVDCLNLALACKAMASDDVWNTATAHAFAARPESFKTGLRRHVEEVHERIEVTIKDSVDRYWYMDGKLHSTLGRPAIIWKSGTCEWCKNGKLHRDGDLPAIVEADGARYWYKDGVRHRDGDLPAVICADGTRCWFKDGVRHRDSDLPAVICADGTRYWWFKDGVEYQPK